MMVDPQLDDILRATLEDFKISRGEKRVLKEILDSAKADSQRRAFVRSRAFELARDEVLGPQARGAIDWLEAIVKILHADDSQLAQQPRSRIFFSPGDSCVHAIVGLFEQAQATVDICVFTITDDRISDAIVATRNRGVAIRIISDNDKAEDRGSDVERFIQAGIGVAVDRTRHHMHHKFAIFDRSITLTGSYNWTRSAAEQNAENILITHERRIADRFQEEFDRLWDEFRSP